MGPPTPFVSDRIEAFEARGLPEGPLIATARVCNGRHHMISPITSGRLHPRALHERNRLRLYCAGMNLQVAQAALEPPSTTRASRATYEADATVHVPAPNAMRPDLVLPMISCALPDAREGTFYSAVGANFSQKNSRADATRPGHAPDL